MSRARLLAYECLIEVQKRDARADSLIDSIIDRAHLDAKDKAFATRLVLGVVQMRGSLDLILDRCMRKPTDVKMDVRCALRISAYEIIYLDKDPYACVSQGVELVKEIAPRAGGVANAVLRKVARAKEAFPFGDPRTDIHAYALLHGFPVWLVEKQIEDLGSSAAHAFVTASNEPAPLYIAVNRARARDEDVLDAFKEAGFALAPATSGGIGTPGCFQVVDRRALADGRIARLLKGGHFIVSDATSQAIAYLIASELFGESSPLDPAQTSFLELCAGRGTKTVLLQSDILRLTGHQIDDFTTLDNIAFKESVLKKRVQDLGIRVRRSITGDATQLDGLLKTERFDCIFIDAPCSGLGTLRRHPEIRWRLHPADIAAFARTDGRILESAANHVSAGGLLAYATCTTTAEEDSAAIVEFLKSDAGAPFDLVPIDGASSFQPPLIPGGPDAHFLVLMRKAR